MNLKERVEELEKRVRELEARPVYVPIYVQPPSHAQPNWPTWQPPYVVTCSAEPISSPGQVWIVN